MLQLLQNLQKNVFAAIAAIAAIPSTSLHLLLADLLRRAVTLRRRHRGVLSLCAADTEACCHFAPPTPTEYKGNFSLITVYSHIAQL
jgi:hypothetical protein